MKKYTLYLTIFALAVFSGCSSKDIAIQTQDVLVPTPMKCKQVECDSVENKDDVTVLKIMLKCLEERRLSLELCK